MLQSHNKENLNVILIQRITITQLKELRVLGIGQAEFFSLNEDPITCNIWLCCSVGSKVKVGHGFEFRRNLMHISSFWLYPDFKIIS